MDSSEFWFYVFFAFLLMAVFAMIVAIIARNAIGNNSDPQNSTSFATQPILSGLDNSLTVLKK